MAGAIFLGLAALARPQRPGFRRSMIVGGVCAGALPALFALTFPAIAVAAALLGGTYGGFVGARIADLRRS
jgi:hypothetical protein